MLVYIYIYLYVCVCLVIIFIFLFFFSLAVQLPRIFYLRTQHPLTFSLWLIFTTHGKSCILKHRVIVYEQHTQRVSGLTKLLFVFLIHTVGFVLYCIEAHSVHRPLKIRRTMSKALILYFFFYFSLSLSLYRSLYNLLSFVEFVMFVFVFVFCFFFLFCFGWSFSLFNVSFVIAVVVIKFAHVKEHKIQNVYNYSFVWQLNNNGAYTSIVNVLVPQKKASLTLSFSLKRDSLKCWFCIYLFFIHDIKKIVNLIKYSNIHN